MIANLDVAAGSRIIDECAVTNVFLAEPARPADNRLGFWSVAFGNEIARAITATPPNEVLGTAETGWIFGDSNKLSRAADESLYFVVPGRSVEIIDECGNALPPGSVGKIAIHKSDPGLFTAYFGEMADVSLGGWFLIGMSGYKTEGSVLRVVTQRD
jgi:acyl-coenzyme A synthetase/AMP-(fatty) acid ligase